MPEIFQFSPDELLKEASSAFASGITTVLLFGIPDAKDERASGAYARNGVVQQTVRLLKKQLPELLVITDVCLCEYMSHGHCGIVRPGSRGATVSNDPTLKLLARTALSHAEAAWRVARHDVHSRDDERDIARCSRSRSSSKA